MKYLSPEQSYFAQEDLSHDQREASEALDTIDRMRRRALAAIVAELTKLRDTIDDSSDNVACAFPTPDPQEWQRILDAAHDLVHDVGFSQVNAIKEFVG